MPGRRALAWGLAIAAGLSVLGLRLLAVQNVAFNWDELALFDRVARTVAEGVLHTGGRPGLTELVLAPLVAECSDEIAVGRSARALWLGFTLAYLAGVTALLLELLRGRRERLHDAALGVALLGLLPAFLEWSLQVRTDQLALAGGAWGCAALVASRRLPALALAAGLAFGIGWLSSQKLFYLAALGGLLSLVPLLADREWRPGREALRAGLTLAGFGAVWLGFRALVGALFTVPDEHVSTRIVDPVLLEASLDVFEFYRNTIGYAQYRALLPTLGPHAVLLAGLVAATIAGVRHVASRPGRSPGSVWRVSGAWAVLTLGLAVGGFHAAAFSYFWMTLGLFPAVALALGVGPARDWLRARAPHAVAPAAAGLWLALLVPAGIQSLELLRDTQSVQRESLAFVHRNFAPTHQGFHPERGVFCGGGQPLRLWFSQNIYRHFGDPSRSAPERERSAAALLEEFRAKQIHYLVQSFRLNQFPVAVRRFWAENYQPYRGAVFVAGRRLEGRPGPAGLEIIAPGPYRWLPRGPQGLRIDGREIEPGGIVELAAGAHSVELAASDPNAELPAAGPGGVLVLALAEPPGVAPLPFYKTY